MLKRIITSLVALCVLIPILVLSNTIVLPIAVGIVLVICIYEMLKCMGKEKNLFISVPLYLFSLISPLMLRYMSNIQFALIAFICASAYAIYLFCLIIWSCGKLSFVEALSMYSIVIYIIAALLSILYVRDYGDSGKFLYLLVFIGAWVTDIFAYFTGYFFGKHKLIEAVSPKKTVEGSIGGIVFCSASFVLYGIIIESFFDTDVNIIFLMISGIIVSVIAQVGDLIMSVIKRHYSIKDYGKIFPGHGGMLDRFDSILSVSLGLAAICMFMTLTGINLI